MLLPVDEAREIVRRHARRLPGVESIPLGRACGRVLAAPVRADRDDPPFPRAMMDGWAVRAADTAPAPVALEPAGRVAAGDAALPPVAPGCAVWVNTGAPVPPGADAVVPVERTRGEVEVLEPAAPGACIQPRASLARAGDVVAGGLLTPEKVAVCASAGADPVEVVRRPRVALLATGTELRADPGPHQIRNSNGAMLHALLAPVADLIELPAAPDDAAALERSVRRGLEEADVLATTGGVSKGDLDLVRPVLERSGVEVAFHGVALQPGKPVLFGLRGARSVFGLPGNPVSALVCTDLFVLPYVAALGGRGFDEPLREWRGRLLAPARSSPRRRRVFPCVRRGDGVEPLPWRSSADLYTVTRANGYLVIEAGRDLPAGADANCLVPERFGPA